MFISRGHIKLTVNLKILLGDKKWLLESITQRNIRTNCVDLRQYKPEPRTENDLRVGYIVDLRCPMVLTILQSNPDFFQAHQIYALISNSSFDHLLGHFQVQNGVRLDSDISIFTAKGGIYDLYKIDNARHINSKVIVQENGSWNGSQISSNYDSTHCKVPTRRLNLWNVTLDAVIYVRFGSIIFERDLKPFL